LLDAGSAEGMVPSCGRPDCANCGGEIRGVEVPCEASRGRFVGLEKILSVLSGVDVSKLNDGHGLGCPCPTCAVRREMALRDPPPGSILGEVRAAARRRRRCN